MGTYREERASLIRQTLLENTLGGNECLVTMIINANQGVLRDFEHE
jgi:hypothetical protein